MSETCKHTFVLAHAVGYLVWMFNVYLSGIDLISCLPLELNVYVIARIKLPAKLKGGKLATWIHSFAVFYGYLNCVEHTQYSNGSSAQFDSDICILYHFKFVNEVNSVLLFWKEKTEKIEISLLTLCTMCIPMIWYFGCVNVHVLQVMNARFIHFKYGHLNFV